LTGFPLAPGAVIGILGGGQLGRMLAMAAARLGFDVAVLDKSGFRELTEQEKDKLLQQFTNNS
jgi:phosphoribosylaminoimidazole carboxylase (NCAIR synthetase)